MLTLLTCTQIVCIRALPASCVTALVRTIGNVKRIVFALSIIAGCGNGLGPLTCPEGFVFATNGDVCCPEGTRWAGPDGVCYITPLSYASPACWYLTPAELAAEIRHEVDQLQAFGQGASADSLALRQTGCEQGCRGIGNFPVPPGFYSCMFHCEDCNLAIVEAVFFVAD